jgi:hypothetical protein
MAKKAFYSFEYLPDYWRAAKVRQIGSIEGNQSISDNDWEKVKSGRDPAIEHWINAQLVGRSCVIVLIGSSTANRRWVKYEIEQGWNMNKGIVGIHIHNLLDRYNRQATKGANPFSNFTINGVTPLSSVVKTYDPPYVTSSSVYGYIATNLEQWVNEAIAIRAKYR